MESRIEIRETPEGLKANFGNKEVFLKYPGDIWQSYPQKSKPALIDNLAYLLTINLPMVARLEKLHYNTALPVFQPFYNMVVLRSVPSAVETYSDNTWGVLQHLLNIEYLFDDPHAKLPEYDGVLQEKAVVPFSSGKDSLLTLAVAHELGLDPVATYFVDTVSPKENAMKMEYSKRLAKDLGIKLHHVTNEFEKLNDFETWNVPETCLGYSHMMTGFCFLSLPVMHYHKARYLFLGNQQDMNFGFVNEDGIKTFPSFDQMWGWTKHQSTMVKLMTAKQGSVSSLIEPLTNLAIVKVLFNRYPQFAKYQISCDCSDDVQTPQRWCYQCPKCARLYLFMKAHNIDVGRVNFETDFFDKEHLKYYSLFDGSDSDEYERSAEARDQQMYAFYLALKNGAKGYLVDKFKKDFYAEARMREDEFHKKFMQPHESHTMDEKIKSKVMKIYEEELL
ncbi:MAG: hypothetical protein ABIF10_08040 [Candidatus Woesearchaeota archaeon]